MAVTAEGGLLFDVRPGERIGEDDRVCFAAAREAALAAGWRYLVVPAVQREAVEFKVWRKGRSDPLAEGLTQLDDYLRRLDLDQGTLVIFDRRPDALPIAERTHFEVTQTPAGRKVTLLRA